MVSLTQAKARIFRIVHVANIPWMLQHDGMGCRNSSELDPDFVNIGNPDLISRRTSHPVPIDLGGTLGDYVPFYFTPSSIMMYNITTGYGGILQREKRDLVIVVSSLLRLSELGLPFVFSNQHAYHMGTEFYSNIADLQHIDWPLLQSCNFKTDDNDPGKALRYQAEALIYQRVPLTAVTGICCYDDDVRRNLESQVEKQGAGIHVRTTPDLYI